MKTHNEMVDLLRRVQRWDKLTPEEKERRMRLHPHNSLLGHIRRASLAMVAVQRAGTVSDKGKDYALDIAGLLELLEHEIREHRVDPTT